MTTDELRSKFEAWYVENAFDYPSNPIGSRECSLQWKAWQAAYASRDAEVEALRKDAERLTWFETQREAYGFEDVHEGNRWTIEGPFNTLRKAIDAAMREGE